MTAVQGTDLWPADLHLIGKDILRFHAIYWPAFLMAGGLPLPKQIFAHGWILVQESKMSKSRGNVVRPTPIASVMGNGNELAGADALRYFLWREIPFGADGNFSYDALIERYNADLANGIGNLASRTLAMIQQYCNGTIPDKAYVDGYEHTAKDTAEAVAEHFNNFEFTQGIEDVLALVSKTDKWIVEYAPWKLVKQGDTKRLGEILYTAADCLRLVCILMYPVLPHAMPKIWSQLGMQGQLEDSAVDGKIGAQQKIGTPEAVFPRIDAKVAIPKMQELEIVEKQRQDELLGKKAAEIPKEETNTISIDDFAKVDLRVGEVKSAEHVKGSDKLLHLKVDVGEPEPRTIVAGIALAYKPEQLVGRKVVIVANLQPRKLRGVTSQGMIVAASVEGGLPVLAGFHEDIDVGARLK
jgi:methionyl-tRNA synthetase